MLVAFHELFLVDYYQLSTLHNQYLSHCSYGLSVTRGALLFSCRAKAEARVDNEEPDGHGSTDPRTGSAEVTGGPSAVRASLHGEVCT